MGRQATVETGSSFKSAGTTDVDGGGEIERQRADCAVGGGMPFGASM